MKYTVRTTIDVKNCHKCNEYQVIITQPITSMTTTLFGYLHKSNDIELDFLVKWPLMEILKVRLWTKDYGHFF